MPKRRPPTGPRLRKLNGFEVPKYKYDFIISRYGAIKIAGKLLLGVDYRVFINRYPKPGACSVSIYLPEDPRYFTYLHSDNPEFIAFKESVMNILKEKVPVEG